MKNIHKCNTAFACALFILGHMLFLAGARGQGTLLVTFDGPPLQPPGTAYGKQSYRENEVWFTPIPGTDGFIRVGSNPTTSRPDNGSAYIQASAGDSLRFGFNAGGLFDLISIDLAEYSTVFPFPARVTFIGYKSNGSTVTTELLTDGIIDGTGPLADFETLHFGPEFSGLIEVRIPTTGWSLDNLVLSIPEPSTASLLLLAAGLFLRRLRKRHGR